MTTQNFIARLNWRQILIHFIAAWFFMYAFQTLAFLFDTKLLDIIRQPNFQDQINALNENGVTTSQLIDLNLWTRISGTAGLLVAFVISLTISIKQHWFWINSVIVLIVIYLLNWFGLLGWTYLKNIFLTPGQIFNSTTLEFLSNGIILLVLGLLTFFLRRPNEFINSSKVATA